VVPTLFVTGTGTVGTAAGAELVLRRENGRRWIQEPGQWRHLYHSLFQIILLLHDRRLAGVLEPVTGI
jgi:hypothetical protein